MLQTGLPAKERLLLLEQLFAEFVSVDEGQFADELYLSVEDLRLLEAAGMHVGGHGSAHHRCAALEDDELDVEIRDTIDLLSRLDQADGVRSFCYPYGSYDKRTTSILADQGFDFSFTVEPRIARLGIDHQMALPRLDTTDLLHWARCDTDKSRL